MFEPADPQNILFSACFPFTPCTYFVEIFVNSLLKPFEQYYFLAFLDVAGDIAAHCTVIGLKHFRDFTKENRV